MMMILQRFFCLQNDQIMSHIIVEGNLWPSYCYLPIATCNQLLPATNQAQDETSCPVHGKGTHKRNSGLEYEKTTEELVKLPEENSTSQNDLVLLTSFWSTW